MIWQGYELSSADRYAKSERQARVAVGRAVLELSEQSRTPQGGLLNSLGRQALEARSPDISKPIVDTEIDSLGQE